MVITKTPVRFSYVGGGTDYPEYYESNPGAVIGSTIDKYAYISVSSEQKFVEHDIRITYSKAEWVNSIDEIEHPSVRECLRHTGITSNIEIHYMADLPARTGLGSSSSFTVGLLKALYAHQGKRIGKKQLAEEAIHVEQDLIGENVGSQDQYHASFGDLREYEFTGDKIQTDPVIVSKNFKDELDDQVLMFYTGMKRYADEILDEQIEKTEKGSNDENLSEMYSLVDEVRRSIEEEESITRFGDLMHEGWELKKKLSSKVTNPKINEAYEAARSAGALGGKLAGAGAGGFLFLVVPTSKKENVRTALSELSEVDFSFDEDGAQVAYYQPNMMA